MTTFIGRGPGTSPTTDFFPLSGSTASSPGILITGTTSAAQTPVHTADANAFDSPYVIVSNVSAATVTVYGQIGSTATTGQRQFLITPGAFTVAYSYDFPISKSGVLGFWSTATAGVYVTGQVARFYTASS